MKRIIAQRCFLAFSAVFILFPAAVRAQTPPSNDNFTNRIFLSGSPVTFSGTTSNATSEVAVYPDVWYSWTATESSRVILERLAYASPVVGAVCVLDLFRGTNFNGADYSTFTNRMFIESTGFGAELQTFKSFLSFNAVAGTTYHLRFYDILGPTDSQFTLRLLTTNAPVILAQPQDQVATANDSVIFQVAAIGPAAYQWRHNGTNLYGQTARTLQLMPVPIFHLSSNHWVARNEIEAGDYDVVLSDPTGTNYTQSTTSAVARLTLVSPPPIPARLLLLSLVTNQTLFQLDCEPDRRFDFESSTNLQNWIQGIMNMSVVFNSSTDIYSGRGTTINMLAERGQLFVRPLRRWGATQVCTNNLKLLQFAKEQWAGDLFKTTTDHPVLFSDLVGPGKYIRGVFHGNGFFGEDWRAMECPGYGTYTVNNIATRPTCTVPSHTLSE